MARQKMVQVAVPVEKPTILDRGLRPLAVTIEEAGELLSISRAHIYNVVKEGELRTVSLGPATRENPPTPALEFPTRLIS